MEYGKATRSYVKLKMHLLPRDVTLIPVGDIDLFPPIRGNNLLTLVYLPCIMTLRDKIVLVRKGR